VAVGVASLAFPDGKDAARIFVRVDLEALAIQAL